MTRSPFRPEPAKRQCLCGRRHGRAILAIIKRLIICQQLSLDQPVHAAQAAFAAADQVAPALVSTVIKRLIIRLQQALDLQTQATQRPAGAAGQACHEPDSRVIKRLIISQLPSLDQPVHAAQAAFAAADQVAPALVSTVIKRLIIRQQRSLGLQLQATQMPASAAGQACHALDSSVIKRLIIGALPSIATVKSTLSPLFRYLNTFPLNVQDQHGVMKVPLHLYADAHHDRCGPRVYTNERPHSLTTRTPLLRGFLFLGSRKGNAMN